MQALVVLCLLVVSTFSVELEHDGDIHDKLDVRKIVETDELRTMAYACLMDLSPCSEEYQIIRDVIPRILKTKCADCNPSQKQIYEYNARYLEMNHKDLLKAMLARYGQ